MKKRGLGRNLDVLLNRSKSTVADVAVQPQQEFAADANTTELRTLAIEALQRGRYQPRKEFPAESLQELADSIRVQGIIQPVVVRAIGDKRYEIIAGERRWRAAQLAGLTEIPALVKDIPDSAALAIALIENIQREDLNPIEEAIALQRLIDEFAMTHEQIAAAVGKSRATVSNLLRLLSLQSDVKTMVEQGQLEMGHARALLALPILAQSELARKIVAEGLSVRVAEHLAQHWQQSSIAQSKTSSQQTVDPNIQQLQRELSSKLGALVVLQPGSKGKGKMVIRYNSLDELEGILERIQ